VKKKYSLKLWLIVAYSVNWVKSNIPLLMEHDRT